MRVDVAADHAIKGTSYLDCDVSEDLESVLVFKGLSLSKGYAEGGLDLLPSSSKSGRSRVAKLTLSTFITCWSSGAVIRIDPPPMILIPVHRPTGSPNLVASKVRDAPGEDKQPMLIANVQKVEATQYAGPLSAPLRKRIAATTFSPANFTLSTVNGSHKAIFGIALGERELDVFRTGRVGGGHSVQGQIKRGSQVMNGITHDERKAWWDGLLLFVGKRPHRPCGVPGYNPYLIPPAL